MRLGLVGLKFLALFNVGTVFVFTYCFRVFFIFGSKKYFNFS